MQVSLKVFKYYYQFSKLINVVLKFSNITIFINQLSSVVEYNMSAKT